MSRAKIIRVTVKPFRRLRIYNPHGREHPIIDGRAILEGEVRNIAGNDWVIFRTQRNFGLPLDVAPFEEERIELDLHEAEAMGDIELEVLQGETQ